MHKKNEIMEKELNKGIDGSWVEENWMKKDLKKKKGILKKKDMKIT